MSISLNWIRMIKTDCMYNHVLQENMSLCLKVFYKVNQEVAQATFLYQPLMPPFSLNMSPVVNVTVTVLKVKVIVISL